MKGNFDIAQPMVLVHEGGYVNHPDDPGGATNKGVTQRTYDGYRKRRGMAPRSVRNITDSEVSEIYRIQYWNKVSADDLPAGVDYAVYDFAVNSGPARAAKFLQEVVGVSADGIIGEQTLAAVSDADPAAVIDQLCSNRLAWLKRLKHFKTFGRGWTRRVDEVRDAALSMHARGTPKPAATPTAEAQAKATGDEKAAATLKDIARDPRSWAAGPALLGALGGVMEGEGPIQYALAAAIVVGVLVLAFRMLRK